MIISVNKDDKIKALLGIEIEQRGQRTAFTPLDIAYTLAQVYSRATVGANAYLTMKFPENCVVLQLTGPAQATIKECIDADGTDLYFDAGGTFQFAGEEEPNPDRAASAFCELYKEGKAILGPPYAVFEAKCVHTYVEQHFGDQVSIYLYGPET